MKIAASIVSWVGGVGTIIFGLIFILMGFVDPYTSERLAYPSWVWAFWLIDVVAVIAILLWRQYATSHGSKIACGICTMIFASLIGGILTLCIPEYDLY